MAQGIIKKFSNALGFEDSTEYEDQRGPILLTRPQFRIMVYQPSEFDDLQKIANSLLDRAGVLIHFDRADAALRRRIIDYMNGVGYAIGAQVEKISDNIVFYAPEHAVIEKEEVFSSKSSKWF